MSTGTALPHLPSQKSPVEAFMISGQRSSETDWTREGMKPEGNHVLMSEGRVFSADSREDICSEDPMPGPCARPVAFKSLGVHLHSR